MTHLVNKDSEIVIAGVASPTILRYFETLNAEAFQLTASLFSEAGILYPPFEAGVVGREAIATYLEKEAKGMKALPREGIVQPAETESYESKVKVMGKVQTSLFSINVSWCFELNAQDEILTIRVKLLAALEELLSLQR
jgi:hypothetical protein